MFSEFEIRSRWQSDFKKAFRVFRFAEIPWKKNKKPRKSEMSRSMDLKNSGTVAPSMKIKASLIQYMLFHTPPSSV